MLGLLGINIPRDVTGLSISSKCLHSSKCHRVLNICKRCRKHQPENAAMSSSKVHVQSKTDDTRTMKAVQWHGKCVLETCNYSFRCVCL